MDRQLLINKRLHFYRDSFRALITLVFAGFILCIALIALIFYQFSKRPAVNYFATTSDGRLIEIVPE